MMEINNLTSSKIDYSFLGDIADKVLEREHIKKREFSIAVVDVKTIRGINKKYRRKDKETDVLSFDCGIDLAEIIICPAVIKKNAKKLNLGYNEEIARVFIHGVLHIAGYSHEGSKKDAKKMKQKTDYYLSHI